MLDQVRDRPGAAGAEAPARRLPLAGAAPTEIGTRLRVKPLPAQERLVLRGGPAARAALAATLGLALPGGVGGSAEADGRVGLCLGPDEWLVLAPAGDRALAEAAVAPYPDGVAVEIGHRQTGIAVAGELGPALLNAGCPLDLGLAAFPAGRCTRTLLGKAEIVLWRRAPLLFHLDVARTLAPYAWAFLQEASRGILSLPAMPLG